MHDKIQTEITPNRSITSIEFLQESKSAKSEHQEGMRGSKRLSLRCIVAACPACHGWWRHWLGRTSSRRGREGEWRAVESAVHATAVRVLLLSLQHQQRGNTKLTDKILWDKTCLEVISPPHRFTPMNSSGGTLPDFLT